MKLAVQMNVKDIKVGVADIKVLSSIFSMLNIQSVLIFNPEFWNLKVEKKKCISHFQSVLRNILSRFGPTKPRGLFIKYQSKSITQLQKYFLPNFNS